MSFAHVNRESRVASRRLILSLEARDSELGTPDRSRTK
jgi:hypothetical protein